MPSPATRDMTTRWGHLRHNPCPMLPFTPIKHCALGQIYVGMMILVYPVGIPVLFAYLLLIRRDNINPPPVDDEAGESTVGVRAPPLPSSRGHHRALSDLTEIDTSTTSYIINMDEIRPVGCQGTAVGYNETLKRLDSIGGDISSRGDSVFSMHMPTALAHRKKVKTRSFHLDEDGGIGVEETGDDVDRHRMIEPWD